MEAGEKKKGGKSAGKRCIAAGCSNTNAVEGVAIFLFPKDEALSKAWTKEVRKTRKDWKEATKHSVLCSTHFTLDCFEEGPMMRAAMGIETKRRFLLKKGAIPTIFPRASAIESQPPPSSSTTTSVTGKPPRTAYAKRKRKRDNMPYTKQLYDIWHVAKSVGKKVKALCKLNTCEDLQPWLQSIINHLYWAVVSSPTGDGELIVGKWKSVERHVQNLHRGHSGKFKSCVHKRLRGRRSKKKWIKPSSLSAVKLEQLVTNKMLCKDIAMLSPKYQTSKIEAFHSLIIQFAPKMYVYSYTGMLCRTLLAGLHYNENSSRLTATTTAGHKRYSIRFPKYKHGGHVVKKIMQDATYNYVDDLIREVVTLSKEAVVDRPEHLQEPPTLAEGMDRPEKAEAILKHTSRFKTH